MKEHFCTYEQAINLCEIGFDSEVATSYYIRAWMDAPKLVDRFLALTEAEMYDGTDVYPAPRLDQAAAWMREEKGWDVYTIPTLGEYGKKKYRWQICHWDNPEYGDESRGIFEDYNEALSAGIDKALELLGKEVKE